MVIKRGIIRHNYFSNNKIFQKMKKLFNFYSAATAQQPRSNRKNGGC